MLFYSKITAHNPSHVAHSLFMAYGAEEDSIILDNSFAPKSPDGVFQKMKHKLIYTRESLTIDSLRSLGKTNREIAKELQWFKQNNIRLIILNLPSTIQESAPPIDLLSELYNLLAGAEIENVKENQRTGIARLRQQNAPLGRKKIPYPANWEETYLRWERKEITANEFMALTGLKKGTLYNLIKQYKESKEIAKQA